MIGTSHKCHNCCRRKSALRKHPPILWHRPRPNEYTIWRWIAGTIAWRTLWNCCLSWETLCKGWSRITLRESAHILRNERSNSWSLMTSVWLTRSTRQWEFRSMQSTSGGGCSISISHKSMLSMGIPWLLILCPKWRKLRVSWACLRTWRRRISFLMIPRASIVFRMRSGESVWRDPKGGNIHVLMTSQSESWKGENVFWFIFYLSITRVLISFSASWAGC